MIADLPGKRPYLVFACPSSLFMSCENDRCTSTNLQNLERIEIAFAPSCFLHRLEFEQPVTPIDGTESRVERVIVRDEDRLSIFSEIDDWTVQKLLGGLTDEPRSCDALLEAASLFGTLPIRRPA